LTSGSFSVTMDMAGSEFMEVSQLPYYSELALFSKPTSFGTVTVQVSSPAEKPYKNNNRNLPETLYN